MQKQRKLQYIAVDGPIGAGKATLVKMLAEDLGGETLFETSDKNPFLHDFYKNPKENAFKAQMYFLLNRYQQQSQLKQRDMFGPETIVCGYTFAKDWIFAKLNLSEEEFQLYSTVFNTLHPKLASPDLVIYLKADSKVMLKRIKKRGWGFEKPITHEYLDKLTEAYNQFFLNYNEAPLLVVDTSCTDYLNKPEDFENLKRAILSHRGGTTHLISR